jgi:AbiV family abortive infection protein
VRNLRKASKMAGLAFKNAIRLHKDAILLYKNGSYPSANQLSILAQEEIGKAFILEEHVYQVTLYPESIDIKTEDLLIKSLLSHKVKQGWFSRQAVDFLEDRRKKLPKFWKEVTTGKLEELKQNSTYVGLSKQGGKINIKGRLIEPWSRVKQEEVKGYITRVNDYIKILIVGCRRGVYSVDTYEVDALLTLELWHELSTLWEYTSPKTEVLIEEIRKFDIE